MTERWVPDAVARATDSDGAVRVEAAFSASSPWFEGHFPRKKTLPGVALLQWAAHEARERARSSGREAAVDGFRHVRFKRLVGPDESLTLRVAVGSLPDEHGVWDLSFQIRSAGASVCRGTLRLR